MPSTHQFGGDDVDYPNDSYKMLATKNDATIRSLIRGIRRVDRAREFVEAELQLADDEGREPRRAFVGMCNAKITELSDDGD